MSDPFAEAVQHHRAGRLDRAAEIYRSILTVVPEHSDSLNLLGVVLHQKGESAQAVPLIERAIALRPERIPYYVNLAAALRAVGRHEEAIRCCTEALARDPSLYEANLALAMSQIALKKLTEAEVVLRNLTESNIGDSRGPQLLGKCLREQGRTDEAIASYQRALERDPNDGAAQLELGTLFLVDMNSIRAEPQLRRATELLPGVVQAWINYGSCLVKLSREREAIAVLEKGFDRFPDDVGIAVNLGQAWLACGENRKAENCFSSVLKIRPNLPEALCGLADVHSAEDRIEEAMPLYERAIELDPMCNGYKGLANAHWESGAVERAVEVLKKGILDHPRDPENYIRLAVMYSAGGDLEAAEESYRTSLQIRPGYPVALVGLAQTMRSKMPAEEAAQLEQSLTRTIPEPMRAGVHFGLAQVAEARGDFAVAADHLRNANALTAAYNKARKHGYDPAEFGRDIDRIIATFTTEFFDRVKGFGVSDERPVFVVGMPRSGTTLIEQILASHPQVYGAGERRFAYQSLLRLVQENSRPGEERLDCMARLSREMVSKSASWHLEQMQRLDGGRAARVVDKMPENYMLLGWLAVQFPKAKFIHSRRDVRDIAISCWMTNFSMARWANDLEHIARRIRDYQRMMEHWRKVLPVPMLENDYEQLVADQESESRRLVDWIGLDWHPKCLEFDKLQRLVKTASVTQVRQPMYSRSVGRWRHYEKTLQPLIRQLQMN
jgi:tetratricopeptide (TPR) repeat protein